MSQEVRKLQPILLWNNFENLNAVPRPSKKEERVIAFMIDFGESLGFEVIEDSSDWNESTRDIPLDLMDGE